MRNWLHGPSLAEWIEEESPKAAAQLRTVNPTFARAFRGWQTKDRSVTVEAADRWLVRLGLPLSWVPEDMYREGDPHRGGVVYPEEVRRYCVREAESGRTHADISNEVGCSTDIIAKWRRKYREGVLV